LTQDVKPQPLLGRDRELEHLDTGLADACAGHGRLYLITGEPGIGKTRLAEALGARAAAKGMISIWGRCWENPGAPVYWPWAQALRALIDARDPALLQEELGGGGDWIAEIVPELRQRVSGIEPLRPLRSEQARFALFDAVNTFLRCVSENDPILLVLDDLHAADIESLAMLDFVVRSLGAMHTMIVAAYQDAAVHDRPDEVEKLFSALGSRSRHLPLGGVEEDDMRMIVEAELGASPPRELVHSLHTTTEGNPFFACEVTRLLVAEGQLTAGSMGGDGAALPLPETVKETIRRRFDPVESAGMEMLKSAAVIGRDFRFRTLESVLGCDSETLIGLLDEALAANLIVEVPGAIGRYRFTHGLVQKTLYSELTARERTRLHQRVGNALEEVYGDATEHLAELAHHFAAAAPTGIAERALDYATRAGHEAMRVLAYDRAAEHFNLALDLAEQFGLERPVELQLARGLALTRIQDPSARDRLLEAAAAARAANRADLLAEAAIGIHVFNLTPGVPDETSVSLLEEALERIGDEDSALRARLLARLATALYYKPGTADRRNSLVTDAVDMARRLDDPAVLAYVLINGQLATWGPDTTERDLEWVDELLVLTADAGNVELALQTRTRQIDYLLELDDLPVPTLRSRRSSEWPRTTPTRGRSRTPLCRGRGGLRLKAGSRRRSAATRRPPASVPRSKTAWFSCWRWHSWRCCAGTREGSVRSRRSYDASRIQPQASSAGAPHSRGSTVTSAARQRPGGSSID
jgi:AAA ATPase-like protein